MIRRGTAAAVDELRAREYARLDELDQAYLDYTGGGLYAESQVREHQELLTRACVRQPAFDEPQLGGDDGARG